MSVVTAAGRPGPRRPERARKDLMLEIARRLRAAKTDEEAADALAAAVELGRGD